MSEEVEAIVGDEHGFIPLRFDGGHLNCSICGAYTVFRSRKTKKPICALCAVTNSTEPSTSKEKDHE